MSLSDQQMTARYCKTVVTYFCLTYLIVKISHTKQLCPKTFACYNILIKLCIRNKASLTEEQEFLVLLVPVHVSINHEQKSLEI